MVSLFASGPIVYYAVEGGLEHVVGVNRKAQAMYQDSIYAELVPGYLKLDMDVAGDHFAPNVEAILALKPDAVFQWTFDPKVIEPLERVGLKVVGWACCTNQDRRDYLSFSGYASGRIDRAQAILRTRMPPIRRCARSSPLSSPRISRHARGRQDQGQHPGRRQQLPGLHLSGAGISPPTRPANGGARSTGSSSWSEILRSSSSPPMRRS